MWIFIALKNQSHLAGIEHANVGSNGKHASNSTTEDESGAILTKLPHVLITKGPSPLHKKKKTRHTYYVTKIL
jgi:hypothetical protein